MAIATFASLLVLTSPAAAHGRGSDATNFDSRLLNTPDLDAVSWGVQGSDEYLSVTNTSGSELVVLGYEGEPYLRVGPEGVWRNRNSPATYLNEDRYAQTTVPSHADPEAEPDWERISDGSDHYWHDHRIHWMAPVVPPQVRDNPTDAQVVQDWTVPFVVEGEQYEVAGELWWVPAPPAWPWVVLGVLLSLPALAGVRASDREDGLRLLVRPAAAVLGVVALLNVIHLVDDVAAAPAPLPNTLLAAVQTAMFLGIGLFGAVRGWQAGDGAFTALGVGSGAVLIGQGILYAPVLASSQLTSVFPEVLGRLAIGWSIGQALPVGLVAVLGTRRLMPDEPAEPFEAEAAPL